ncbi:hypothetical protein C8Q73DRAFT_682142 [Cubamyces lactineus]|nr:hypothetical protein C8Q73DRAFT_682142 [Cubamyces lactineus]
MHPMSDRAPRAPRCRTSPRSRGWRPYAESAQRTIESVPPAGAPRAACPAFSAGSCQPLSMPRSTTSLRVTHRVRARACCAPPSHRPLAAPHRNRWATGRAVCISEIPAENRGRGSRRGRNITRRDSCVPGGWCAGGDRTTGRQATGGIEQPLSCETVHEQRTAGERVLSHLKEINALRTYELRGTLPLAHARAAAGPSRCRTLSTDPRTRGMRP